MAQQSRPVELAQKRSGELLERIRKNNDLDLGTQLVEKFFAPFEWPQTADYLLDIEKLQPMVVEDGQSPAHQLVVIGLVPSGAAQFVDAGLFGHGNPDFR